MKKIFYDFEVFKYDWLVVFIDYDTREKTIIVNNPIQLREFYEMQKDNIFCGYNSRTYDQVIFKSILCALDPWEVNIDIIENGKKEHQILGKKNKIPFNNYDCLLLNKSLKQLEGFLNSKIKESSVPFNLDRKLTKEEIEETIEYCTHDVEQTIKVFDNTTQEFDAQLGLIETFNLPMSSFGKTKAQLVAEILQAKRYEGAKDEFNVSIPNTLILSEKYQHIADWYKDKKNHNYSRKLKCDVAGCPHIFGYGGIHGALSNISAEGIILCCDVASLYPSIIIEYDYMSRGVKDVKTYKEIRDTRLEYKRIKDPRQAPLKIVLNSAYGTFKDEYNALYDPLQSNNVCIAGQLLLVDLIDKIEPFCKLLQSNTDGVFLLVENKETVEKIKEIAKEWETRTRLELEWDEYIKLVQKDVNNYLLIPDGNLYDEKGKPRWKSKGQYLKQLSPIDSDLLIVNKALIEYFLNNIPIEKTIRDSKNLSDFQKIVKVSRLYSHALVNGEIVKEKVLRVFASTNEKDGFIYKVKLVDGEEKLEKIGYTPDKCFINNEDISNTPIPNNLDIQYYISYANDCLDKFLKESNQKSKKEKSQIKGLNEETYNLLMDIDLEDYATFTDLLVYIKTNTNCTKTAVAILIKIEYFSKFGGGKKLLDVWDMFYNELKYSPSQSDKSKNEKYENCLNFEEQLENVDFKWSEKLEYRKKYLGTFISGIEEERPILVVEKVYEATRKSDGVRFGYNITTLSVGSGIKGRFTIKNKDWKNNGEICENDIIRCIDKHNENGFWNMLSYKKIGIYN